jgi:hypothetical protein
MKNIDATAHARKRMHQRAISEMQIRLIKEFGEYQYQKGGTNVAIIPVKTLTALRYAIDKLGSVRVVLGDSDKVVTAMHETHRADKTRYAA